MSNHPSFTRCHAVALRNGSTAKTTRGVARFLRENKGARRSLCPRTWPMDATAWKLQDKARKADPDAKRARTDKPFRRRYLAGLNRRESKAIACDGTLAGVMAHYGGNVVINHRVAELVYCARLRSIVTGKTCKPITSPVYGHKIGIDKTTALTHGVTITTRGKDYSILSTKSESHLVHEDGSTEWKNGKAVGYVRATNDNYVRSLAVIRDSQTLDYVCHETRYTILLPVGYTWGIDGNGLRAVMTGTADDYHPTAAELIHECCVPGSIAHKIRANRDERQKWAAQHSAELADIAGVFVCLADSLRAGNCRQGTIVFAERHGLDIRKHYAAPDLLVQANGEAGRVRLAITAARIRHERETAQGFCNFSDHTV